MTCTGSGERLLAVIFEIKHQIEEAYRAPLGDDAFEALRSSLHSVLRDA